MSNFEAPAFNPASVAVENATWRDDYFGRHEYGVMFADGTVYRPEQVGIEACASALTSLTRQLEELREQAEFLRAELDAIFSHLTSPSDVLDRVRAEERERCARVAEECVLIDAAAIRALGDK